MALVKAISNHPVIERRKSVIPLFIIFDEVLSRLISKNVTYGKMIAYKTHIDSPRISHHPYSDDLMIFLNGSKNSLKAFMDTLKIYVTISSQKINHTKSTMFSLNNLQHLKRRLGFIL